jgi:hypothetical protein
MIEGIRRNPLRSATGALIAMAVLLGGLLAFG